jgi:hypothetical protein
MTCLFLIGHPHSIFSKIEDGWRKSVEHAKVLIHRSGFSEKKKLDSNEQLHSALLPADCKCSRISAKHMVSLKSLTFH